MEYFLLFVLLCLVFLHLYLHHGRCGKLMSRLPGPTMLPILGNALQVNVSPAEIFKRVRQWSKTYYPIFRVWIVNVPLVHIRHPDDIEIVLTSKNHINKKFGYEHLHKWLKSGLLTSSGKKWHHRRKILTPAFHFNILKKQMEMMLERAETLISNLKNKGSIIDVNLVPFCTEYSLKIICESSMGAVVDGETGNEAANYKKALDDMVYMVVYRLLRPYIKDWILPLLPNINKKIKNSITESDRFINEIIKQRRQYHQENNYKDLEQLQNDTQDLKDMYLDGTKKRLALLDLLLAAERNKLIDHEGIKEEVATFVFAGHDTTETAMTFVIMVLADHEEIQSRARKEVEEIFRRNNGIFDFSDLKDMVYLERCIKESLRLYPSVPSISREMTEDLQLKHCLVPKGSNVVLSIVDVHRDPNFWPEPNKFDPDRFLPDKTIIRHPFSYIPFSAGFRNCIGQKFAMIELKILMALILYNFHLEPIDRLCDIELVADIILRPNRPVQTRFVKIDR
ncbi:cytochrome P450 4C1-like [Copidosoma floridanum]|uniref:cytochrome P450 4C1-like n=1 Tax=Copidosoma floridanum TaxID=29053 RepID=UPI0006C9DAEB|nr:cytochrome P450 4C1-like [Copidosoma floridanum]XP_014216833.1 cytochrome P450 4C1-like [Copidosoma floridanum]XP_014216834.1 cytochrome P450 4C1-like [Copidosoma floridanum]